MPATQNYGEGIFIDFNSEIFKKHIKSPGVEERLEILEKKLLKDENAFFNNIDFNLNLLLFTLLSSINK